MLAPVLCECAGCLDGEDCWGAWPPPPLRPRLRPGASVFVCAVCGSEYNRRLLPGGESAGARVTCSAVCLGVRLRRIAARQQAERSGRRCVRCHRNRPLRTRSTCTSPACQGRITADRERVARSSRCPYCHAHPGQPCTRQGGRAHRSHEARLRAARAKESRALAG